MAGDGILTDSLEKCHFYANITLEKCKKSDVFALEKCILFGFMLVFK